MSNYLLVFLATALADVAWTMYFIEVERRRKVLAATWSASIVALGTFTVTEYVHNPRLAVAAVAGAFVGTWATLAWKDEGLRKRWCAWWRQYWHDLGQGGGPSWYS